MYQIDFNKPAKVHFIGIGGISMSGLAEILMERGFTVSGSDSRQSELTDMLAFRGAKVYYGQRAGNLADDLAVVVYTAAVHPDNAEFAEAMRRGLPMLTRAQLLGQIMKNYPHAVAVAGTHGKSTTTSMLTEILLKADMDPTISVGGMLDSIGGNIRTGKSGYFVTEACEYTNSFLSLFPTVGVILNIQEDHLDFFKDLEDIRSSFARFASLLPEDGLLVLNGSIDRAEELCSGLRCRTVRYGRGSDWDYGACNIRYDGQARPSFTLYIKGEPAGEIELGVSGEHNIDNALAAIAAALDLGAPMEAVKAGLSSFGGIHRRFEKKGEIGGVTVIDDYAHHPTEIAASLRTAKSCPHNKIWCVFQPHTYTRTKAFLKEFAKALSIADEIVLADIFAARETDSLGISSRNLAEELQKLGASVHYFPSFDEIENFLLQNCIHGDMLITMGAGDIVKVGEKLLGC